MEIENNKFRAALQRANVAYGAWLGIPSGVAAEIAAVAGFDWLLIDHEHAPFTLESVYQHLQALAAYPSAAVVRPVSDDPALLKKFVDIGVETFLVPMVETAEQASKIVAALKYPPQGSRGLGVSLSRAAKWGHVDDYLALANEQLCILVQVETAKGIDNLVDILSVPGVDGVFFGPSDLSASMGHIGQPGHPDVVSTISDSLRLTRSAERYAGVLSLDPAATNTYRQSGANFIGVGVDTMVLANQLSSIAKAAGKHFVGAEPASDENSTY